MGTVIKRNKVKNIEAINHIKDIRETIRAEHMCKSIDGECTKEDIVIYQKQIKALNIAIKLIGTHIPKAPVEMYADGVLVCPICRGVLEKGEERCILCGQLIDWRDAQ